MIHALNFLMLAVFFTAWWLADLHFATVALIVAAALQVAVLRIVQKSVPKVTLVTFLMILFFGGLTLVFRDVFFIKIKTTVLYYLFATVLLAADFIAKKNLAQLLLQKHFDAPRFLWRQVSTAMAVFCLTLATVNWLIVHYYDDTIWVTAKTFAYPLGSVIFLAALLLYLGARATLKNDNETQR